MIHWFLSLHYDPKMFIQKILESMNKRYTYYKHNLDTEGQDCKSTQTDTLVKGVLDIYST